MNQARYTCYSPVLRKILRMCADFPKKKGKN